MRHDEQLYLSNSQNLSGQAEGHEIHEVYGYETRPAPTRTSYLKVREICRSVHSQLESASDFEAEGRKVPGAVKRPIYGRLESLRGQVVSIG